MTMYAAVDIGTNALRLLIAETDGLQRDLRPLLQQRRITRLGAGLSRSGNISEEAQERTLQALLSFQNTIRDQGVGKVTVAATSAVREAKNGKEFLRQAEKVTGWTIEVLSGEEEARRTLLGVLHAFRPIPAFSLILDIGGGSTEFSYARQATPRLLLSTPLGVVHLAERHLHTDPIALEELEGLRKEVEREVRQVKELLPDDPPSTLICTAGTATTLAILDLKLEVFDPLAIHLHTLGRETVQVLLDGLAAMTLEERRQLPFLERGREDLIIPGSVILLQTMRILGIDRFTVSETGLKEGLLLHLLERERR